MSLVEQLIAELSPDGVPFAAIGDPSVSQRIVAGATPRSGTAEYWENGTIPWMSSGEVNKGTVYETDKLITQAAYDATSTKMLPPGAVVIALAGQGKTRGTVARTRIELCTNQSLASIVTAESMESDFLYFFLQTQYMQLREVSSGDGTRGGLNLQMIRAYMVPVPPLEVQRAIVRILDQFTLLEAELEAELEARRRQYGHYQRSLLTFAEDNASWMTLGDIGKVSMCKRVFKSETASDGDIPFFKIGTFGGEPDAFISRELYENYRSRYSYPQTGDVLISAAGTIGRTIPYDGEPAYFQDSNIVWIGNDETIVLNSYLRHWYGVIEWATDGGTIRRLYNENIRRARIAVPPLKEQERIVAILDKFDALVNDLSVGLPAELAARRKQYQYYRDRFMTFEEAAS